MPGGAGRPPRSVLWWWLRHRRSGWHRPSPRLSVSTASPAIAFCSCAAKPCSSWRIGHYRASSSLSGAEMPSSRFIAEAYPCCGWRGARNICCCRSHWTRSSGRLPLCGCGRSSNGSWSRWITWSRYWLTCRNLFCWIGCCRCSGERCLRARDVAHTSHLRDRHWPSDHAGHLPASIQPASRARARSSGVSISRPSAGAFRTCTVSAGSCRRRAPKPRSPLAPT